MGIHNWTDIGDEILNSVLKAVDSGDFTNLNKNIGHTINNAFTDQKSTSCNHEPEHTQNRDGNSGSCQQRYKPGTRYRATAGSAFEELVHAVGDAVRDGVETSKKEAARLQNQAQEYRMRASVNQPPALYRKNLPGKYSGPLLATFGGIGTGIFGLTAIGLGIGAIWVNGMGIAAGIVGLITAGFIGMTVRGAKVCGRNRRFKEYVKYIGKKQYCNLADLARSAGRSVEFVKKDIRRMFQAGYFLQGHIDREETTLITSNEVYEQYLITEENRKQQERSLEERRKERQQYTAEVQELLEEGEAYIRHIHECNDAIPGEEISAKLQRLEDVMIRIFEQLKKQPESADDLHKLMTYYLPTTTKLIDAYRDLDEKPSFGSQNIEKTKREIEDTLDTINNAFEKLFDDMFEDTAWDISSDISTMKTMFAQEGLTENRDFM